MTIFWRKNKGKLLLAVLLCTMFLCIAADRRYAYHSSVFRETKKFLVGVESNIEICNTGSNPGKFAFDWGEVDDLRGYNFATGPQSLYYDHVLLRHYRGHLTSNAVVVITLAPLATLKYHHPAPANVIRYYPVLEKDEIRSFSWTTYLRCKWTQLKLLGDYNSIPSDPALEFDGRPEPKMLRGFAEFLYKDWGKNFEITDFQAPMTDINREKFNEMLVQVRAFLDWCIAEGLRPALVVCPVTHDYDDQFTDYFCKTYIYDFIEQLNRPNVPFLDYLKDERFRKPEYFVNSLMLNNTGRKLFTREIVSELRKRGLLSSK